jgi:5-carboxymethyl-2-hydroxymuconate isomerase
MRLGHQLGLDGRPELFVESGGSRLTIEGTLDDLIVDPDAIQRLHLLVRQRGFTTAAPAAPDSPLLPPILKPGKIIGIGLNYLDHCREFGVAPPDRLVLFPKLASSLVGHGAVVRWDPRITQEVDWEVELAIVIGRRGRWLDRDAARESIFGYTIANDVTARDIQRAEQQWLRAKGLDTFCPLGPVVVTADEITDPQDLAIMSRINGVVMQHSTTAEMIVGVYDLVSELSKSFSLEPGDIILSGTPVGVGGFRNPPIYLSDGDVMEMEIAQIGVLRNQCAVESRVLVESRRE